MRIVFSVFLTRLQGVECNGHGHETIVFITKMCKNFLHLVVIAFSVKTLKAICTRYGALFQRNMTLALRDKCFVQRFLFHESLHMEKKRFAIFS